MAETPTSAAQVIRFGVFEVDLQAAELRRNGVKVKLQEQPFQILNLLLERPGKVVTREEIQHKLWPDGTFVDFEHSLNAAVKRLREALGDSADNPRFVETLPRRGYRFIYPVEGRDRASHTWQVALVLAALGVLLAGAASFFYFQRAYALTGDTTSSRRAYQDFLALWKDADPDIPILLEAKAEYGKLR